MVARNELSTIYRPGSVEERISVAGWHAGELWVAALRARLQAATQTAGAPNGTPIAAHLAVPPLPAFERLVHREVWMTAFMQVIGARLCGNGGGLMIVAALCDWTQRTFSGSGRDLTLSGDPLSFHSQDSA